MFRWTPYVFVRFTLFLSAGIVLHACFPAASMSVITAAFVFCLILYGILWFIRHRDLALVPILTGIVAGMLTAAFGWLVTWHATDAHQPDHVVHRYADMDYYIGTVVSEVQTRAKNYRLVVSVQQIRRGLKWERAQGKVLLYTSRQSAKPAYGDRLLVRGRPQKLQPPANPGEFDYQHFLSLQQIHLQQFVRVNSFQIYAHAPTNHLYRWSLRLRSWADGVLHQYMPQPQEYAIVSGLVLGIRDGMDNELKNAYTAAGAMHILAVSGAHVIVIFQLIVGLLGWTRRFPYGNWVFACLALVLLWFYACVTGLSASVLRAVCMFSLIILGKAANRKGNLFNTLGISAFGLLCYDPYLLQDVGFQLSYLAVAGIVYLHPRIYHWWNLNNRWLDKLWESVSISLAAQLAVFPLILFYFHQFPMYFLLANLCMIPLSVGILYGGLALLTFSWIPYVAQGLAFVIHWGTWLLNQMAFVTERTPGAVVQGIHVGRWELGVLYLCLLVALYFFYRPSLHRWAWIAAGLLGVVGSQNYSKYAYHDQQLLAVYAIPGHSTLDVMEGKYHVFLADSALLHNPNRILFHLRTHWGERQALNAHKSHFSQATTSQLAICYKPAYSLLTWHGKQFCLLHQSTELPQALYPQLDYLIVQNNSLKTNALPDTWKGKVIIDGSNRYYFSKRLSQALQQKQISCHNVQQQGAFLLSF